MAKGGKMWFALFVMCSFVIVMVCAGDSDPLQDLCVAQINRKDVIVNGFTCKPAGEISADDFFFYRGLAKAGNTNNMFGSSVTPANVMQIPGLNTLGISMVRIDYAPNGGLNPPHTHPRATEILVVIEGTLNVGFVTTDNLLFTKTLDKGDVFVFPKALVHFQQNVGYGNAVAIAALSSQLPGTQQIAKSLFGSSPPIDDAVLAKAFQIDTKLVDQLQAKFMSDSDPLQDLCVAQINLKDVIVNGFTCKPAGEISADDFFFYRGLAKAGNTNNMFGSSVTPANVMQIPGLNTLGISMVRIDYAPNGGLNPPHTHPRATEILVVIEGTLNVGFVTTDNLLFTKTLDKGDVFVFPKALVHFQQNVGYGNAAAIAALSSQLPGTQQIAKSLFGSSPPIDDVVLEKAFQIDTKLVDQLQAKFMS